jgi:hypothetical protein
MKAIVRTAAARRSRLGNAQVASPTLAAQSAPLLARESSRRRNLLIRLQQSRFGRSSYHANLLAGLGGPASEAIEPF